MDGWLLGQLAFVYTWHTVQPASIVDKCIEMWVDIMVPGHGVGENTWWMRSWRSIEQSAEKTSREADIRANLRQWDQDYPALHHELLVRYLAGALASVVAMTIYDWIRGPRGRQYRKYY